ncbi:MAG: hypothetical protein AAGA68_22590 [Pseudomonadota bacterium]
MSESIARIKMEEVANRRTAYIDVSSEIDLGDEAPSLRKMPCIAIDLRCFLPLTWDAMHKGAKADFRECLGLEDAPNRSAEELASRTEYSQNNSVVGGEGNIPNYDVAMDPIMRVIEEEVDSPENPTPLEEGDTLKLHPLKLLYFLMSIESERIATVDRDVVDLLFDKVALAALLPHIFSSGTWPVNEKMEELMNAEDIASAFDSLLVANWSRRDILSFPDKSIMMSADLEIELEPEYWRGMLKYATYPDENAYYVSLSIEDLDEILSDHLKDQFSRRRAMVTSGKEFWEALTNNMRSLGSYRRSDYGYFYDVIDKFFADRKRPLSYGKIPFLGEGNEPPLPYIDFVDLKPLYWQQDATTLSTEMRIASTRHKKALKKFNDTSENELEALNSAEEELRRAIAHWNRAKTDFEKLSQEVQKEGYELKVDAQPNEQAFSLDGTYQLTRKKTVIYDVRVKKRERRFRTKVDMVPIRKCKRTRKKFLGFTYKTKTRCFTQLTPRHRRVPFTRSWYVVERRSKSVPEVVAVDHQPLENYLNQAVSVASFSSLDQAKVFAEKHLPGVVVDANTKEIAGVTNGHKKIFTFSIVDDQYISEEGRTLDSILNELDDSSLAELNSVLFLIPKMIPMTSSESRLEGYYAVHTPSLGRGSLDEPRIYLQENYSVTVGREAGHWMGKLSHVESLFPGEKRVIKLGVERSEEIIQSREQSENEKVSNSKSKELEDRLTDSFEQEKERKSTKRWNAKASGGANFGVWKAGGSAGASGESSDRTKEVKKKVSQSLEKVASSYSRDKEVNFRANFSHTSTSAYSREETREFSNINQGRSVNYKFFQVMQKYHMSMSLRGLKVVVEYSDELIPGLDVSQIEVYGLDQLEQLFPEIIEEQRSAVITSVERYIKERHKERKVLYSDGSEDTVQFLELDEEERILGIASGNVFDRQSWFTNSGAYTVETEVSSEKATEDYIDQARDAEIENQQAHSKKIEAQAKAIEAGRVVLPDGVDTINMTLAGEHPSLGKAGEA